MRHRQKKRRRLRCRAEVTRSSWARSRAPNSVERCLARSNVICLENQCSPPSVIPTGASRWHWFMLPEGAPMPAQVKSAAADGSLGTTTNSATSPGGEARNAVVRIYVLRAECRARTADLSAFPLYQLSPPHCFSATPDSLFSRSFLPDRFQRLTNFLASGQCRTTATSIPK
jgi:hypothetical protein